MTIPLKFNWCENHRAGHTLRSPLPSLRIIPEWLAKNGQERIIVLNDVARKVDDSKAGLAHVRIHDLKHTFGHRLRAAGVPFEERQDLLGHRSARITTHYSAPDIARLLEAAERVCKPALHTVLRIESHPKVTHDESRPRPALPKLSAI